MENLLSLIASQIKSYLLFRGFRKVPIRTETLSFLYSKTGGDVHAVLSQSLKIYDKLTLEFEQVYVQLHQRPLERYKVTSGRVSYLSGSWDFIDIKPSRQACQRVFRLAFLHKCTFDEVISNAFTNYLELIRLTDVGANFYNRDWDGFHPISVFQDDDDDEETAKKPKHTVAGAQIIQFQKRK